MVRKGGLEPPRSCERQPLKLVRLPIPPLPQEGQFTVVNSQPSVDAKLSWTREQKQLATDRRTNTTSSAPGAELARVPWEQAPWTSACHALARSPKSTPKCAGWPKPTA
jgi:hypothetical protein